MPRPEKLSRATDIVFRVGLVLKAVDSAFEVLGGVLLAVPARLVRILLVISQHEAFRHHQALAGRLDNLAQVIGTHTSIVQAIYLMLHGAVKLVCILAIFRGKRWGYTWLVFFITIFAGIELFQAIRAGEVLTGVFGAFDLVLAVLIYKEFRAHFLTKSQEDATA
jgi:uncharacterized membrane protein